MNTDTEWVCTACGRINHQSWGACLFCSAAKPSPVPTEEESRKAFESVPNNLDSNYHRVSADGPYLFTTTEDRWKAWQAAVKWALEAREEQNEASNTTD